MSSVNEQEVRQEVQKYLIVFAGLLAFTIITVAAVYLHLTVPQILLLGGMILLCKGSLVAASFLKLIPQRRLVHWLLLMTAFFLIGILLLPILENVYAVHGTLNVS